MTTYTNALLAHLDTVDLGPLPVPTIVSWSPDDPTVMRFDFKFDTIPAGVTWAIGRDLVLGALADKSGEREFGDDSGNVMVSATELHLMLCLRGVMADGTWDIASLRMPASAVRWVANTSVNIVAPGSELEAAKVQDALVAELAGLLGGAA